MATHALDDRGFSLLELIAVVAVFGVLAAMAVPLWNNTLRSMRLGQAAREMERELQTARLKAVSSNRRLRVRTNCPVAGSYRMVEVLGTAADPPVTRCRADLYRYPAPDNDPLTLPNLDGPVRRLPAEVGATNVSFEFRPDGTAWTVDSAGSVSAIPIAGTTVTLAYGLKTKVVSLNALGKIAMQ